MTESTLIARGTRIARKQHSCNQCRKPIIPTTRYSWATFKHEGRLESYRAHEDCDKLYLYLHQLWNVYYDEWQYLFECDLSEDANWICVEYPDVALRLGIVQRSEVLPSNKES